MNTNWRKMAHQELRKSFRWGSSTVSLRILLGGNGKRTPIAEIKADRAISMNGPNGGRKTRSRYIGGDVLSQRSSLESSKQDLEKWWMDYSSNNEAPDLSALERIRNQSQS